MAIAEPRRTPFVAVVLRGPPAKWLSAGFDREFLLRAATLSRSAPTTTSNRPSIVAPPPSLLGQSTDDFSPWVLFPQEIVTSRQRVASENKRANESQNSLVTD